MKLVPARLAALTTPCAACPLRQTGAFDNNGPDDIAYIQSMKVAERRVAARDAILPQGYVAEHLFTLLEGWAFRFKILSDGRRQILNFLLPGDLLGLQAKLFERADHGIEALTDTVLCVFSRERIWHVFRDRPSLAFDITWLGAREESLVDDGLLSAGRRSATERVAALLLQLVGRARAVGLEQGDTIPFPPTQTHLADALGLSPVHLNRTMQALRRSGLVQLGSGLLRLPDPQALRTLARVSPSPSRPRPLI